MSIINKAGKVTMVVDLQYGSTGKGLIAGFLAETETPDLVVNANMPNAGHTYINSAGREWIHKVLPNGIVSPKLKTILLGGGSIFSISRLKDEIERSADILRGKTILIHPNAVPLKSEHTQKEADTKMVENIGSTAQGSAAAMVEKIGRKPNTTIVASQNKAFQRLLYTIKHVHGINIKVATIKEYNLALMTADKILAEGAQGFSLGIDQQFYPYCTSRNCTPSRFMSDMGIPLGMLREVVGVARTFPIRVAGNSGGWYPDQKEITWEELGQKEELTTVTKKVRRVATFSHQQIRDAVFECQPNRVFLNFMNYVHEDTQSADALNFIQSVHETIKFVLPDSEGVVFAGYGPTFDDVEQ